METAGQSLLYHNNGLIRWLMDQAVSAARNPSHPNFVRDTESSVIRPEKELKGFDKVALQPGESQTVHFELDKRAFAYYNVELQDWYVETGRFEILVGKSSREVMLQESVHITSTSVWKRTYTRDTTIGDLIEAPKGKELLAKLLHSNPLAEGRDAEYALSLLKAAPVRGLIWFSNGAFSERDLEDLLRKLNGN